MPAKTWFMHQQEAKANAMSETMQDSVNVQIAKLMGYRTRKAQRRTNYWLLVDPNGDEGIELASSEAEAWQHAPDFEHSVDACLAAIGESSDVFFMYTDSGDRLVKLTPRPFSVDEGEYGHFYGRGATRAEAAAAALLAYLTSAVERPDAT